MSIYETEYTDTTGNSPSQIPTPLAGVTFPGDIDDTTSTTTSLSIGSTMSSTIDVSGDRDFVKVQLVAGTAYQFDLKGSATGSGTLGDPFLGLRNSSNTLLMVDDDGASIYTAGSTNSQIVFIAPESGTYFLDVSAYGSATGTYQLSATTLDSNYYTQSVLHQPYRLWNSTGTVGNPVTITYSFPTTLPSDYSSLEVPSFTAFTSTQKTAAVSALNLISSYANITFTQVTGDTGQIRFGNSYQTSSAGLTYPWTLNGNLVQADIFISNGASASYNASPTYGSWGWETLVHEIGHALGQKHPGNYNASGGGTDGPYLPSSQDTTEFTIESYNSDGSPCSTPMIFDIAALQYLYGANQTTATGNNNYTFNTNSIYTIWDAAGTDTLDGSGWSDSLTLNLNPGTVSYAGLIGIGSVPTPCVGIAFNCWIENAKGGSGNDQLLGNVNNNVLTGGAGNDLIDGGAGIDTAVYHGIKSSYTITRTASGYTVSSTDYVLRAYDGTDTLVNVEWLQFNDGLFRLGDTVQNDFNGDGKSDILWRNTSTGDVAIWQMNGTALGSSAIAATAVSLGWAIQDTGDFNGDGKSDILWRNTSTGDVAIWQMNGTAVDSSAIAASAVPLGWAIQGTGDFNGDGKDDLLWRNTNSGDVAIWQMNGTTVGSSAITAPAVPLGWSVQGTGDFNGDGKDDLLWRNTNSGDVAVWQMNGTAVGSSAITATAIPLNWAIQDTGDFNGDGKSDILWRNTSTGDVAVWQMNGTNMETSASVSNGTPLNWVIA